MHQCRESVEEGIRHLITLATGIFKGGVRGREKERKKPPALGAHPGWAVCAFPQSRVGSQKAGQSSPPHPAPLPGHGLGILLPGPGGG